MAGWAACLPLAPRHLSRNLTSPAPGGPLSDSTATECRRKGASPVLGILEETKIYIHFFKVGRKSTTSSSIDVIDNIAISCFYLVPICFQIVKNQIN